METKHTPGPWRIEAGGDNIIRGPNGEFVCCDGTGAFIAISNDHDALLIATAPELLAVLRDCLPFIDDANDITQFFPESAATNACRGAVKRAYEVILKAEGK